MTNPLKVTITTEVDPDKGAIMQRTEGLGGQVFARIIRIEDEQIRRALQMLGWTPPGEATPETYIAIAETYYLCDGHQTVYHKFCDKVGGCTGIWQMIEEFADAFEQQFRGQWEEYDFIELTESYVVTWIDEMLRRDQLLLFHDIHDLLKGAA